MKEIVMMIMIMMMMRLKYGDIKGETESMGFLKKLTFLL
jgi:hypothetical protein